MPIPMLATPEPPSPPPENSSPSHSKKPPIVSDTQRPIVSKNVPMPEKIAPISAICSFHHSRTLSAMLGNQSSNANKPSNPKTSRRPGISLSMGPVRISPMPESMSPMPPQSP